MCCIPDEPSSGKSSIIPVVPLLHYCLSCNFNIYSCEVPGETVQGSKAMSYGSKGPPEGSQELCFYLGPAQDLELPTTLTMACV